MWLLIVLLICAQLLHTALWDFLYWAVVVVIVLLNQSFTSFCYSARFVQGVSWFCHFWCFCCFLSNVLFFDLLIANGHLIDISCLLTKAHLRECWLMCIVHVNEQFDHRKKIMMFMHLTSCNFKSMSAFVKRFDYSLFSYILFFAIIGESLKMAYILIY